MFADFWELYTENGIPEDSTEYWDKLTQDGNEFVAKYDDSRFAKDLYLAVANELERQFLKK